MANILTTITETMPKAMELISLFMKATKTAEPPPAGTTMPYPRELVKKLQTFLNTAVKPNPPLDVDGWVGPKTEQAFDEGMEMLRVMGFK